MGMVKMMGAGVMVTPHQLTLGALLKLSDQLRLDTHSVLFDSIRRSDNPDFYPTSWDDVRVGLPPLPVTRHRGTIM